MRFGALDPERMGIPFPIVREEFGLAAFAPPRLDCQLGLAEGHKKVVDAVDTEQRWRMVAVIPAVPKNVCQNDLVA